ncbi:unnamed protein product [Orchesella dallaii]|uniref:Uncharacterized protein n=1 Tax=Orchesella dallaii TaxID=48710 RepID=A0ABP1QAF5_9HEXA
MDRVKKARTPVRARVTRLHNQIKAEIATGVPFKTTLEVLLERLEAAQARLVELDHLMIQAMLDAGAAEADLEIEDDESEDYQDGVRNAKRLVREAINPNTDSAANSSSTTVGVYVRELLGMVTKNAANPKTTVSLSSMYDKLEAQLRALSSLGINGGNMSVFLHPMIESSLPENILLAWQRSSNYGRDGSLETPPKSKYDYLMEFIRLEVENEAKRTLVSSFDQQQPAVRGKQNTGGNRKNDIPTASSLYVARNDDDCCIFCECCYSSENAKIFLLSEKCQCQRKDYLSLKEKARKQVPADDVLQTRSGRKIMKPARYGTWNN